LEARLGAAARPAPTNGDAVGGSTPPANALEAQPPEAGAPNAWPDESAEVAILSELGERGENPALAATEAVEETDTKDLPPLEELVNRLSPEVRETLDALFRAKFTGVRRVPQKALKQ
jgi:hypothetical protein